MLIRIKQVRKLADGKTPGSNIDLTKRGGPKVILEFRPLDPKQPDVDHVCDVTDPDQVSQLLAIREGFEVHSSELAKKKAGTDDIQKDAGNDQRSAGAQQSKAIGKMSKAELIEAVTKKTGKKPHPSTSESKLKKLLEE